VSTQCLVWTLPNTYTLISSMFSMIADTPLDHIILECPITGYLQCAGRSTVIYVPPICTWLSATNGQSSLYYKLTICMREVSIAQSNLSRYWLLQMLENDWCTYYCNFKDLVFRTSMVLCIRQWPLQGPGLSCRWPQTRFLADALMPLTFGRHSATSLGNL
jgi:hypothetical protein